MSDRLISPEDDPTTDVEGHGMNLGNDNETVVSDELDVKGQHSQANHNETVVSDESEPDVDNNEVVVQN
jgi:hypothetical protein